MAPAPNAHRRARRVLLPNDPRFASVAGNGPTVGQWYLKTPTAEVPASIDAVSAFEMTAFNAEATPNESRFKTRIAYIIHPCVARP